jgi:hypothetical protein
MEKTIIILKLYMFVICETDYKNVFHDYVYYVICHFLQLREGWRVELRGLLIIYFCVYFWFESIPDRFTFVRTAWQTNLWDINDINLLFLEIIQ